jgi:hypothetical protein
MNSETDDRRVQVFHGTRETAIYGDPLIPNYRGNPLIEALPAILSEDEAVHRLARYPQVSDDERALPAHIRYHLILNALQFFEPLPIHLDLEQRISRMIRGGYVARNPLSRTYWQDMNQHVSAATTPKPGAEGHIRSSASGFSIIGISGGGKTTAIEEILRLYPQVLAHSAYNGQPLNRLQVVWLKLACPFDGSIKGLCLNFFDAVDDVLGTTYSRDFAGTGRSTVDQLLPSMARVASIHCLGMLVIDEVQHLNASKSGGSEKMLNFFVQLINTIGLPVLLIGTYGAMPMLTGEFRQIRRSCGQGDLIWEGMKNDDIWEHFLESLWHYQYIRNPTPLTLELRNRLFFESQGITDFAIKMFMLAQVRAISNGIEEITPEIIHSVAIDSFRTAQPVLKALRDGDSMALRRLSDIFPVDFSSEIQRVRSTSLPAQKTSPEILQESGEKTLEEEQLKSSAPKTNPKKSAKRPNCTDASPGSLMDISRKGQQRGVAAYEALKSAGLIRDTSEFLIGVA